MGQPAQKDERREFTRIHFDARTELFQHKRCWPVELVDISLHGMLIKHPHDWQMNKDALLTAHIHLDGFHTMVMAVEYAHEEGDYCGLRINQIDLDSITLLKRLCELNFGDNTLLQRELHALIAPHSS